MPKVNPDEYMDWDSDEEFVIEDDEPVKPKSTIGRKPPKQDLDWEEQRRRMSRKHNRDWD